jgi:type IV secretion system protein VirB9
MTRAITHFGCVMLAGLWASLAPMGVAAQILDVPISGPVDPRVRTVMFREDAVVSLRGHYGYQMMVEFGSDERIENVSIGDSLAWQVTPNRRADTLFLKPIEFNAATNMSVVTSKRRYTFQLSAEEATGLDDPNIIYRVKFTFPPEPLAPAAELTSRATIVAGNMAYSVSGSPANVPARIYDDGSRTYFEWASGAATPAIFALNPDGSEALVNFIMQGNVMVVERVAPAFMLRNGKEETLVSNDGWQPPAPGPQAPVMRDGPAARTPTPRTPWTRRLFGPRTPAATAPPKAAPQ